jgi:hypothetical protein
MRIKEIEHVQLAMPPGKESEARRRGPFMKVYSEYLKFQNRLIWRDVVAVGLFGTR